VLSEERHRGIGALRGLSAPSTKVVFSRDGKWLAALANNWKVAIWNLSSNRLERVLRVPQGLTADNAALAFSPDSDLFAFATSGEAKLWDRKTGLLKKSWPLPAGLQEILWFDLTNQLFLFQWDYSLTGTGGLCCMRELPLIGDPAVLSQFSFFKGRPFDSSASLDGRVLAVCGSLDPATYTNHVLKIFNPQTGEELFPVTSRNTGDGEGLALDPAGQLLECMNEKGGSDFFEVPSGRPAGHAAHLAAAISPGGIWLVSDAAPEDAIQGLRLYRRDAPGRRVLLGAGLRSNQPTFSPDGRLLAWGTSDGTVMVCEMERVISHLTELRLGWR
jgi:WD40 repeat protein